MKVIQNYLITLEEKYDLVNHFILNMPWNLKEHIKYLKIINLIIIKYEYKNKLL